MYRVGVDLGGTNIAVGVINDKMEIIGRGNKKTNLPRPAEEILADIVAAIKLACADAGISTDEIQSVGIGTPGTVNKQTGVIEYANNLAFDQVPAVEILKGMLDVPYYLENDANAAALGEAMAGAGVGKNSFVAITLGTGVGGGIVVGGKIWSGCNGAGGELGHIVIRFDGEPCNCGLVGCWERYASATALIRETREVMEAHPESKMWELAGGTLDGVGGRTAFNAMREGDYWGTKVVEQYEEYVAIGTVNIINAMQPEMICFGGGIANERETLLVPVRDYVAKHRYSRYCKVQTEICSAKLGNDAGIIGAALLDS